VARAARGDLGVSLRSSLPVAALFWHLAPGFSLAPEPTVLEASET